MNDTTNFDVKVWIVGLLVAVLWLWVWFRWVWRATGKPVTRRQPFSGRKIILLCGATAFVFCGLFPPWLYISYQGHTRSAGCSFILSPPPKEGRDYGTKLDISRLAVEWLCIAVATGTVWLLVSKPKKATGNGQETPDKPAKP